MYNEQDYDSMTRAANPDHPVHPASRKRKHRKNRFIRRAAAFTLSAVLFGVIVQGTCYGVSTLLGYAGELDSVSHTSRASGQSFDVTEIAARGLPSVVSVTNISVQEVQRYFGQFGPNGRGPVQLQETTSCGSGVIISASDSALYIVTNYHVAEGATTLSVTFADDQTYETQLCGFDRTMDIALLKVSADILSSDTLSQISVVEIGNSDELAVGEQVVAIGNALGYGQSVTTGIVSALDRTVSTDTGVSTYIQTDAAINPGNSGGALLNMNGELIGINTAKVSSTEVEGIGYAIPVSQILELIESYMN
ncbi:Trypsin-like serine proteases, typically periplasmic, contain C-terminal PDZ domain [[Clostridium] cf. saccharolyticum K10]|nr:Trypsin-like serine proteases, typically periplasmic, contain C-terminal PDZ domain [[Clostridium] cf. saccharolyticum K10]